MSAVDLIVRLAIRARPLFEFARWWLPSAYGLIAALCLLGEWWPGALLCAVIGTTAWRFADVAIKRCREIEEIVRREARREAWAAKWEQGADGSGVEP
jgi:hypothetical protein